MNVYGGQRDHRDDGCWITVMKPTAVVFALLAMSVFSGPQGTGAMRRHRAEKRAAAEARDAATPPDRRRAIRLRNERFARNVAEGQR